MTRDNWLIVGVVAVGAYVLWSTSQQSAPAAQQKLPEPGPAAGPSATEDWVAMAHAFTTETPEANLQTLDRARGGDEAAQGDLARMLASARANSESEMKA